MNQAAAANRVTGSRVLTSSEGLAILKEKEEKKKKEAEEKEKRKLERQEKKKEKEVQASKRAEERRRKAEERAEERLKKAKEKQSRTSARKGTRRQQRTTTAQSHALPADLGPSASTDSSGASFSGSLACVQDSMSYECCECLHTYAEDVHLGTGAEWVLCGSFHVKSTQKIDTYLRFLRNLVPT